jgi:DNA-binding transcriptional ArsR family regulator
LYKYFAQSLSELLNVSGRAKLYKKLPSSISIVLQVLDTLITSKTRVKLLLKFFSNSTNSAYLRSLADEFGESTNGVRIELNRLAEAGLLESEPSGNTILYRANTKSPLFPELKNMVGKYLGFDRIVDQVVRKLGNVQVAFITGGYAKGQDTGIIDLVMVGDVEMLQLHKYLEKTEKLINRKVRPLILSRYEFIQHKKTLLKESHILLWNENKSKQER